jgi:hypothetical protein
MLGMGECLTVMSPLDFQSKIQWSGPNRVIQTRHEWKSESALWQSFYQATAQRVEYRDLLSPLRLREGSDPSGSSDPSALTSFFRGQKSIFFQKSPPCTTDMLEFVVCNSLDNSHESDFWNWPRVHERFLSSLWMPAHLFRGAPLSGSLCKKASGGL